MHPHKSTKRHERSATNSLHGMYAYENEQPSSSQYPTSPHGLNQSSSSRPSYPHHPQSSHARQPMARSHSDGHYYPSSSTGAPYNDPSINSIPPFKSAQSIPSGISSRSSRPAPPPHQSHVHNSHPPHPSHSSHSSHPPSSVRPSGSSSSHKPQGIPSSAYHSGHGGGHSASHSSHPSHPHGHVSHSGHPSHPSHPSHSNHPSHSSHPSHGSHGHHSTNPPGGGHHYSTSYNHHSANSNAVNAMHGGPPPHIHPPSQLSDHSLFNLQGILSIMKQQDPNYQMVTLGMDLTQLGGLDLNCPEPEIHHTFLSPWIDKWDDSNKFVTPSCYQLKRSNEHSATKYMARYKDSTLFYIFYSAVNDRVQVVAAKELYKRKWVYYKPLQLWLHQMSGTGGGSGSDNTDGKGKGRDKKDKTSGGERKEEVDDNTITMEGTGNSGTLPLAEERDKALVFMREVQVEDMEYFDVECWKTKHFYSKFPVDWNVEKDRLLSEHELNHFCKANLAEREPYL